MLRALNSALVWISASACLFIGLSAPAQTLFSDNFDSYSSPVTVTNAGPTNGYNVLSSVAYGPTDFTAIFGFYYSTVTYPTNIVSAPHSSGTKKGLYLTANKDSIGAT